MADINRYFQFSDGQPRPKEHADAPMTTDFPELRDRVEEAVNHPEGPQLVLASGLELARLIDLHDQRGTEIADKDKLIDGLRDALRFGIGCAINELVAAGLPTEWGRHAGIGRMLAALGCSSRRLDDEVRALIADVPPFHDDKLAGFVASAEMKEATIRDLAATISRLTSEAEERERTSNQLLIAANTWQDRAEAGETRIGELEAERERMYADAEHVAHSVVTGTAIMMEEMENRHELKQGARKATARAEAAEARVAALEEALLRVLDTRGKPHHEEYLDRHSYEIARHADDEARALLQPQEQT